MQPVLIIDHTTISQLERHLLVVALRLGGGSPRLHGVFTKHAHIWGGREQSEVIEATRSFLP